MRTSSALFWTASLVIGLLVPASAQRGPLPAPLVKEGVIERISEHVYVIPDGDALLVPNIGIIVGAGGAFVVDSGHVKVIQDELQDRYPRATLAGVSAAAYNEAP
jgi:hypothetical protein